MFSRPQKPPREEEKLLARRSHELTVRSLASPTATASLPPPSPQPTSPLRLSGPNSHYYRSNMPTVSGQPNGSTTTVADAIPTPDALDSRPITINDSFTGESKASLIPDHPSALGSPFMLEGYDARSAPQDRFWSHVAKIRELQSDVARMHIAMESIGRPPEPQPAKEKEKEKDKDKPRKYRGQTTGGRTSMAAASSTDRDETAQSASDTDHAGSGRDSRSGPKATDAPTTGIATDTGEHFAQRKEAIQSIMKKLSELSYQVSEFHQLPTPEITFPISPTRQTQPQSPLTPTQASTFSIPSPGQTSLTYQTPHTTKTGPFQSTLGLQAQAPTPPRLTIPNSQLQVPGSRTEPTTPSKAKPRSIISQDGTFHESPASLQAGRTP